MQSRIILCKETSWLSLSHDSGILNSPGVGGALEPKSRTAGPSSVSRSPCARDVRKKTYCELLCLDCQLGAGSLISIW